ncbi:MAG: hypothetical protein K6E40_18275 [Desulfovibrio sp.]|nr:hypothetical protein [Desulfovibrio sp.]
MNIASLSLPSTVARDMATSAGRKIPRAGFTQLLEFQLFFKNTLWRVSFLPAERLQRGGPPRHAHRLAGYSGKFGILDPAALAAYKVALDKLRLPPAA